MLQVQGCRWCCIIEAACDALGWRRTGGGAHGVYWAGCVSFTLQHAPLITTKHAVAPMADPARRDNLEDAWGSDLEGERHVLEHRLDVRMTIGEPQNVLRQDASAAAATARLFTAAHFAPSPCSLCPDLLLPSSAVLTDNGGPTKPQKWAPQQPAPKQPPTPSRGVPLAAAQRPGEPPRHAQAAGQVGPHSLHSICLGEAHAGGGMHPSIF